MDNPVVWYEGGGASSANRRYLHNDHQGSIIAVSNPANSVIKANTYDTYGIPHANNLGRFSYTGQLYLSEIGLHYYKARIYSAPLGRFLQTDPVGYEDQMNLYAYVGNDPINKIDPTGMTGVIPNMGQMRAQAYSSQRTPQMFRATLVVEEYKAKQSMKIIAATADAGAGAVAAIALGQPEIAGPLAVVSAAASIAENSIDLTSGRDFTSQSNEATLAVGTGEAAGKAAENAVKVAGEAVGALGVKGKAVEKVINVGAEVAGQKVSDTVKDDYLKR